MPERIALTLALTQRIRRSTSNRLFELLCRADALTVAGWRALQKRAARLHEEQLNRQPSLESVAYAHCPYCGFPVIVQAAEMHAYRRCRQCSAGFQPDQSVKPDGQSGRHHPATRPATRRRRLQTRLQQERRALV